MPRGIVEIIFQKNLILSDLYLYLKNAFIIILILLFFLNLYIIFI